MSDNFTTTDQLIRYLDHELSDTERQLLEQQLQEDAALQHTLESLRVAQRSVKLYGLQQTVAGIHQEAMQEMKASTPATGGLVRRITRWSIGVAAAAIVVVAATIGYQYATVSSDKLYSDIYRPYTTSPARGAATSSLKASYAQRNMPQVIQLFEKQPVHTVEDLYLAGNAYLETNNATRAIACFTAAQQQNTRENTAQYAEDIQYYLALAYLRNNDLQTALSLLTAIHDNKQHTYHDMVSKWQITRLEWLVNKK